MGAVFGVLAAIGLGYLLYRQYVKWKQKQQLQGWAGDTVSYLSLDGGTRNRSSTAASMSEVAFATYVNGAHGFEVMHPKEWSCIVSSSPADPIVVQFVCPISERSYKRFSVVRCGVEGLLAPACVRLARRRGRRGHTHPTGSPQRRGGLRW